MPHPEMRTRLFLRWCLHNSLPTDAMKPPKHKLKHDEKLEKKQKKKTELHYVHLLKLPAVRHG